MIKGIHHVSMKCATSDDLAKIKELYCNVLGLKVEREWGGGMMIGTGSGVIEIMVDENGCKDKGVIEHFALASDNIDEMIAEVKKAGYSIILEPEDIVIGSNPELPARIAFFNGPLGEEIELFDEK